MRPCIVLLLALAAAACSPQASTPTAELPLIPTQALPSTVTPSAMLPDGTEIVLELAISEEERGRGLMFRPALAETRGMLFLFDQPGDLSIWMKNTLISLDIVFLDDHGTVIALSENAPPCPGDPCPHYTSGRPAAAVLELAAGTAGRHGLTVGTPVRFSHVSGYPLPAPPAG